MSETQTIDQRLEAIDAALKQARLIPSAPKPWFLMAVKRPANWVCPEGWELKTCGACGCPVEANSAILATKQCEGALCRDCHCLRERGMLPTSQERPAETMEPLERFSRMAHGKFPVPEPPAPRKHGRADGRSS
jgi:hypothetical protein